MNKTNIILILLLFVTYSCGKDDALTKTDLITQSPWILTASIFDPPLETEEGSIVNWYSVMSDCLRDDIYYYYPSGVYTCSEGGSRCSPSDADIWEVGVWTFNDTQTKLYKGIIDYLNEYEILKLDGNELQLRYSFADSLNNVYYNTETFRHP
ncbi:MAG TPA: hypothetical protein VJ346_02150 [Bacteroidales bacterium]|nr:hypothetical protein [Bacteroidales bacterium]